MNIFFIKIFVDSVQYPRYARSAAKKFDADEDEWNLGNFSNITITIVLQRR
jgi:hypothetical protein